MNWKDCKLEVGILMVEMEEGVPFFDSPLSLNLSLTNLDGSEMLQDPTVKAFIKSFEKFGSRVGIEIDNPVPLLTELPGIFITPTTLFTREEVVEAISTHLPEPYTPYIPDFYTIGFFPSRPGCPIREIAQDGKVYENGVHIATEFVVPNEWALGLADTCKPYCNGGYNHHKISADGLRKKVYIYCTEVYPN
jgi:hypothetical protein